jgi:hypothetical protein
VVEVIEEPFDVRFHDPADASIEERMLELLRRRPGSASAAIAHAAVQEVRFIDGLQDPTRRHLHQLVFHHRYPQRALFGAARFRDIPPSHQLRPIALGLQALQQIRQSLVELLTIGRNIDAIHSGGSGTPQLMVTLIEHRQIDHPIQAAKPMFRLRRRLLSQCQQGAGHALMGRFPCPGVSAMPALLSGPSLRPVSGATVSDYYGRV